ncbi:hypothetical protein [Actinoplanes sp. NPDC049118]|uniref:hypothetical protein n=1 Tax=Actinoplanes sp. NPDC049118 TaxID=3155769 RepID=UPI0033FABB1A
MTATVAHSNVATAPFHARSNGGRASPSAASPVHTTRIPSHGQSARVTVASPGFDRTADPSKARLASTRNAGGPYCHSHAQGRSTKRSIGYNGVRLQRKRSARSLPAVGQPGRDALGVPRFRLETVSPESTDRPVCAATAFGVSRTGLHVLFGETRVFAHVRCVWVPPGGATDPFGTTTGLAGPIAATLGDSSGYELPADGESYPDSLRRIFPGRLLSEARDGTVTAEAESELRRRYSL